MTNLVARKECSAEETIKKIKSILNNLGIETDIVLKNKSGDDIYSCRLVIKGTSIGTNGKGVTEELSLASAYAEFMERLQTIYLFGSVNGKSGINIEVKESHINANNSVKILDNLKKYFRSSFDFANDDEAIKIIQETGNRVLPGEYFHVQSKKIVSLPTLEIGRMCGSNGLCAGNTSYEAICQGICELFERMAYRTISIKELSCPTIPREYYIHTNSMKQISYIEKRGFKIIVKDMTLGGKFPVVGAIILSPSKKRIKFSAGSDINFDIALQRCLTEVLQGRELSGFFSTEMQDVYTYQKWNENFYFKDDYKIKELQKAFHNGSGDIPLGFIYSAENFINTNLSVFNNDKISNQTAYKELINILNNNRMDLYIRDYSVFGFPTFRVFIPNESVLFASMKNVFEIDKLYTKIRELSFDEKNLQEITSLLHQMNEVMNIPNEISTSSILGNISIEGDLDDSRWFEVLLYIYQNKFDSAYKMYKRYFENEHISKEILTYLLSLKNKNEKIFKQFCLDTDNQIVLDKIRKIEKDIENISYIINGFNKNTEIDDSLINNYPS